MAAFAGFGSALIARGLRGHPGSAGTFPATYAEYAEARQRTLSFCDAVDFAEVQVCFAADAGIGDARGFYSRIASFVMGLLTWLTPNVEGRINRVAPRASRSFHRHSATPKPRSRFVFA